MALRPNHTYTSRLDTLRLYFDTDVNGQIWLSHCCRAAVLETVMEMLDQGVVSYLQRNVFDSLFVGRYIRKTTMESTRRQQECGSTRL